MVVLYYVIEVMSIHDFLWWLIYLQSLHVGFTSDKGGNTIDVHWDTRKTVLHHVRLMFRLNIGHCHDPEI